jgi:hypothetical protein
MTEGAIDAADQPRKGRRNPQLAAELAASREEGVVAVVPHNDTHALMDDDGAPTPESELYIAGESVVVKITHEFPRADGMSSFYSAGYTRHLGPEEDPQDALSEAAAMVHEHLMTTVNEQWTVVANLQEGIQDEIADRARNRPIQRRRTAN